jgi:hypothetical protein
MKNSYSIKLVSRNEGIEYHDENYVYRFYISLIDKNWIVYLPCSKGNFYQTYEFNEDEKKRIIPRIIDYLENRKYFGIFGSTYPVKFETEGPISKQVEQSRLHASKYWSDQKNKSVKD